MTCRRWTCLAFGGAVLGLLLVVLVHQPMRVQRCATQAADSGPVLACDDRRSWQWPAATGLGAAAVVGALVVGGLASPFLNRQEAAVSRRA